MYQQATEILPFAATLWKDVKFNDIRLQPLLSCCCFVAVFVAYMLSFFYFCCFFLNSGFHFLLSCSQFLMFELARSGNGTAVQEILAKSRQIGVELEEFLNTLLGK